MAAELAELTGESLTTAVLEALRQRLDRERQSRDREAKIAYALALGAEARRVMGDDMPKSTDTNFLYDEHGLPR